VPIARPSAAALVHIRPVAPANAVSLRSDVSHDRRLRGGDGGCPLLGGAAGDLPPTRCPGAYALGPSRFCPEPDSSTASHRCSLRSVTVGRARMGRGHPVCRGVAGRLGSWRFPVAPADLMRKAPRVIHSLWMGLSPTAPLDASLTSPSRGRCHVRHRPDRFRRRRAPR
jgi:hypothetical protein